MEMIGYWMGPRHYRITHPVSGRHSDVILDPGFEKWDDIDRLLAVRKRISETELAGPKPEGVPVGHHYSLPRTLFATSVYDKVMKGEIAPSPLSWKPGERRYYGEYPQHPRALPPEK